MTNAADMLPGFVRRDEYMRVVHGKTDFTGQRWQDKGLLVVRYFGRTPYVDTVATAARARGEDKPRRGRAT
jgi:hypothetical protein